MPGWIELPNTDEDSGSEDRLHRCGEDERLSGSTDDGGRPAESVVIGRFAGCLLGGAVGDALGAPVEFLSLDQIRRQYGAEGIQHYTPAYDRLGAITDDTQMTLFTAEGLIRADNRFRDRGICKTGGVVRRAYLRWLGTQGETRYDPEFPQLHDGWLYQQKELHSLRCPGTTCLSALRSGKHGTIERPINNSKGCGGVMRVAPVGLVARDPFRLACECAAITHGHPSGYLAAGFLAQVIADIRYGSDLPTAIVHTRAVLLDWAHHGECLAAIDAAATCAASDRSPADCIEELGQGWVAEEALAIALFCSLRSFDFTSGVRMAVNHSGDSDSTGAITGNILGTLWGRDAIPAEFLDNLELREVIETIAADLLSIVSIEGYEPDYERYPPW